MDTDMSPAGSAFGGSRSLTLPGMAPGSPIAGLGTLTMEANPGGAGMLDFSLSSFTSGSGMVTWTSPTPVDVTNGGANSLFAFNIISVTSTGVDLSIFVTDEDGDIDLFTLTSPIIGIQEFPFSAYDASIDFDRITEIALLIDGENQAQLNLDSFATAVDPNAGP